MVKIVRRTLSVLVIVFFLFAAAGSAAEVARKVAILPFEVNAAEDLSYLREGILDMLASRLAWEGKVEIIEERAVKEAVAGREGALNEAAARELGQALGADFVLFGSLTVFGKSVSLDAKMLSLTEDRPPVTVYAQTKGMDEVVPRINDFAQDINNKIFGRGPTAVATATAPPPEPRFSQAHPETLVRGQMKAGGPSPPEGQGSFVMLQPDTPGAQSDLWRSQRLDFAVNGMDVGDVDGDGRAEIVVVSDFQRVVVYRWEQGILRQLGKFDGWGSDRFIWVCLLDANSDGKAEIHLSNLRGESLSSYVLEWQGGKLVERASGLGWYFNRVNLPGRGTVLVGQKRRAD
ncbi:MAG: VCBS repeat-containing protein, partial [Deltaproteobacteria bacterium]